MGAGSEGLSRVREWAALDGHRELASTSGIEFFDQSEKILSKQQQTARVSNCGLVLNISSV